MREAEDMLEKQAPKVSLQHSWPKSTPIGPPVPALAHTPARANILNHVTSLKHHLDRLETRLSEAKGTGTRSYCSFIFWGGSAFSNHALVQQGATLRLCYLLRGETNLGVVSSGLWFRSILPHGDGASSQAWSINSRCGQGQGQAHFSAFRDPEPWNTH